MTFLVFIFIIFVRECTHVGEGQREGGTEDLKQLLPDSSKPDVVLEANVGLHSTNPEIMT